jgi:hypothetical protein
MSASPLHYDFSLEKLEDGETQTIQVLLETLQTINETTFSRSVAASGRLRVQLRTDLTSMPIEGASVDGRRTGVPASSWQESLFHRNTDGPKRAQQRAMTAWRSIRGAHCVGTSRWEPSCAPANWPTR